MTPRARGATAELLALCEKFREDMRADLKAQLVSQGCEPDVAACMAAVYERVWHEGCVNIVLYGSPHAP